MAACPAGALTLVGMKYASPFRYALSHRVGVTPPRSTRIRYRRWENSRIDVFAG